MNENDVLFQKLTQAYSEKKIRVLLSGVEPKTLGSTPDRSTRIFFPSMPVSLSGIIHHSQKKKVFEVFLLNILVRCPRPISSSYNKPFF